ncbi:ribonucleoside-diphosphate reductase class II [Entomoplasma freundtii]|uniref:Vitamin B12-dependent ribonucleotide reductase n=1 Tax=Entomoplasma freundtii TaxID=74700 RepID=A0A2K8NRN1_9MOLU|nr:vitamin B12-dependent ribonucleotide reductase [Entomoplasma freundtii]ATZ16512.1 ribonucleotide-diphosphate reductase subunit alpha [Entomoplasma freundtii]TDY56042.1 ribonucleoside-diphosphate reductase class II [Entomoplasma freundtii]
MYSQAQITHLNADIKNHFDNIFQIEPGFKLHFEGVSRMVMLDRYAQKDETLKTLEVGDLILTIIKNDPHFPTRGIGQVIKMEPNGDCLVKIEDQYVGMISPEFLADRLVPNLIKTSKDQLVKPLELYFEQIARRVGNHLGQNETHDITKSFVHELETLNFVPAGRVLYGAGSNKQVTYFNCYVMPYIKDSREGLAAHRAKVAEIMSRGGGVGTNGSTLRPKGAPALNVGGSSSGAVSWLNDLSGLTHLIEQGGSRRGAQMIMMADWHPDIVEFIISKMQNIKSLLFIKDHFKSPLIQNEVQRKINFKNFDPTQRQIYETVLSHSEAFEPHFIKEVEAKLLSGGEYEVNNPEFLTGANISVAISDKFMEAIENDADWDLKFPDNRHFTPEQKEFYEKNWADMGNVFEWESLGYPVKTYRTIRARELWQLINFCATYSAEPGIFFLDRANKMTNAQGYDQRVVATNPCGEQPLAPYSVCNLGAINLANFVNKETQTIEFEKLKKTVATAVRFQDNIIDLTPYFLEENQNQALGERRVGLGVMGLHDLLIWSGHRYGSEKANDLVDQVFETIALAAYETSIALAKEKGSFPFLTDREKFVKSGYLQTLPQNIRDGIIENGLRNSHLLTVAPTGSTGTMVGGSTGLEPYFAFSYYRSGRLGKFMEVKVPLVEDWLSYHPDYQNRQLPDIFVSAMQLTPEEHATVQCIIQRWVDSSISKTVNAPKGFTVKQVQEVYNNLYKMGAKGGTIYVDGSRDTQVLSLEKEENLFGEEFIAQGTGLTKPETFQDDKTTHFGYGSGDACALCQLGTLIESAGCVTCNNCNVQVKCGL